MTAYGPKTRMSRNMEAVATAILLKDAEIKGDLFPKSEEKFGTNEPIPASDILLPQVRKVGTLYYSTASKNTLRVKAGIDMNKSYISTPTAHSAPLNVKYQAPSTIMLKLRTRYGFALGKHWPTNFRQTVEQRNDGTIQAKQWDMACKKCHQGIRIRTRLNRKHEHINKWIYTDKAGKPLRLNKIELKTVLEGHQTMSLREIVKLVREAPRSIVSATIASKKYWPPYFLDCAGTNQTADSMNDPTSKAMKKYGTAITIVNIPTPPERKVLALFNRIIRLRRKAQGSD